jgi:hypothetical protein
MMVIGLSGQAQALGLAARAAALAQTSAAIFLHPVVGVVVMFVSCFQGVAEIWLSDGSLRVVNVNI